MSQTAEPTIRRRADGSIDTDFYVRSARQLHAVAIQEDGPRWIARLCARIASALSARDVRHATTARPG